MLSNLRARILDNSPLAPRRWLAQHCLLCAADDAKNVVCGECELALTRARHACPRCGVATPSGETCGRCLRKPPAFERTVFAMDYAFPADRLLQALKYNAQLPLADWCARALMRHVDVKHVDAIVAMPMHRRRLALRGFNHAMEIARPLARRLERPLFADAARRTRDTREQAELKWTERRANVRGAFAVDERVKGKRIAIVDDVMTTGASLDELARALLRAGATRVTAWVVARTQRDSLRRARGHATLAGVLDEPGV